MRRLIHTLRSNAALDAALISILLFVFCIRIWNVGILHTDDALWALWTHQSSTDPAGDWARNQGRLYAFPYGAMMLHALAAVGTTYGELLRVGSFAVFFALFHILVAVYCGRRLALLSGSFFFAFFALRWEQSVLTAGPLSPWVFGSAALLAALLARACARTGRPVLAIAAGLCLFASLFTNEAMALYHAGFFVLMVLWNALGAMTMRPSLRMVVSELIRPGATRTLLAVFLVAFGCYAALSIGWRTQHPSRYDGHVLAPFSLMRIAEAALQFATSNSILRDFVQPYTVSFADVLVHGGNQASYRPLGFARTLVLYPAALMFGLMVAYQFYRAASERELPARGWFPARAEALALLVGLSLAFLPMLPPAATAKYQGWYFNQAVTSFSTSIFSYFGVGLALAAVFSLLLRPLRARWRPLLLLAPAFALGTVAAISYRMNDAIALDMRSESGRWRVLAQALESIDAARMEVAAIWAPRFRSGSWFTVVATSYWTEYAKARYQADVRFLDALPPSDKLEGVAYLDYSLADDDRSYIATVARLRPPDTSEPRVLADMIAVHVEQQTATMLRTHRLSFLDRRGSLRQIPLDRLAPRGPRGEIRVADNVQALPTSIRIERQSLLERDPRPCASAVTVGQTVQFGTNVDPSGWSCVGPSFLQSGWGAMEVGGVWSLGKHARISLALAGMPRETFELAFDLSTYTGLGFHRGTQTIRVLAQDRLLATWTFTTDAPPPETRIGVTPDLLDASGTLHIAFEIDPPMSARRLGTANDDRELGINLRAIRTIPAAGSSRSSP